GGKNRKRHGGRRRRGGQDHAQARHQSADHFLSLRRCRRDHRKARKTSRLYNCASMPQRFLLRRSTLFALILVTLFLVGGAEPSGTFNVSGQARTRTCAAMKGKKIPLRFADGTPTGFFAWADDPRMQGRNQPDCPVGSLELDAQETIFTGDGMRLFFHPGGGPGHYKDCVENGQYGHVALDDLKAPPTLKPQKLN